MPSLRRGRPRRPALPGLRHVHARRRDRRAVPVLRRARHHRRAHRRRLSPDRPPVPSPAHTRRETPVMTTTAAMNDAAAAYQRLRGHLAYLKLTAAAEALPALLDAAREKLMGIEAEATAARKLTARLHFAALPARGGSRTTTSPPSPALMRR